MEVLDRVEKMDIKVLGEMAWPKRFQGLSGLPSMILRMATLMIKNAAPQQSEAISQAQARKWVRQEAL